MGIYRTTDPTQFDAVDGIIIDESAPPAQVSGVQTNVACLVGQFERGATDTVLEPTSTAELLELVGNNLAYSGLLELQNKKFGELKLIRVKPASSALATLAVLNVTPATALTFSAKQDVGVYGNGIEITVAAGSTQGSKYTIHDNNASAKYPDEVYDNLLIANAAATINAASNLVSVVAGVTALEPVVLAATPLAGGSDGTVVDTDYQAAILTVAEAQGTCNFLWSDKYSSTIKGYLKQHAADVQDDMVVLAPDTVSVSKATAIAEVPTYRDVDGRIIYAFNPLMSNIGGVLVPTSPASWLVSILSQTAPSIDPAYSANAQFMSGASDIQFKLTRQDYIDLKNAGICAFENDSDIGIKPKSGIVTQIADSSKITILRRRMADYLTDSAAKFLKNYQNAPNTLGNRTAVKAAISNFVNTQGKNGILPKDSEVNSGKASLVDTNVLNSDLSIGQGFFYVKWLQRIFSSMRYIVIVAQIGETVVVTDQS
jgi:hypothetical protein